LYSNLDKNDETFLNHILSKIMKGQTQVSNIGGLMKKVMVLSAFVLGLAIWAYAAPSYAWDHSYHHNYRHGYHGYHRNHGNHGYQGHRSHHHGHRDYPHFGVRLNLLPRGHISIGFGGSRFYYSEGVYYRRVRNDYEVVAPPTGVVVREIPPYYQEVVINGVRYYSSNGIYYVYTPQGYQVVPTPTVIQQQPVLVSSNASVPVQVTPATTGDDIEVFTINVPNDKGGYTPVAIKRSEKGFVGPQGELYEEFPKIAQLKTMYGK
jgi:hypothetical protein